MKHLKMISLAAVATMAMAAFTAGTASATTLEIGGVVQNKAVTFTMSLKKETSMLMQLTGGGFWQTCTESHMHGSTTVFTSATVSAPISAWSFAKCTNEKVVVDKPGSLTIERIGATTNGTVRSAGAEVTVPSPIGTLNCKTGAGVDIGTLTGVTAGNATMDINAITNCGFLAPSATWQGTYSVTSPAGLGVVS